MRYILLLLGVVALAGSGCGPRDALPADPDQLIVFSIDGPSYFKNEGQLTPEQARGEVLYGYPVLGHVEVTDPHQRQAILSAISDAIRNNSEPEAKCFIPRHVVRTLKSGETTDLVICFECRNYRTARQGNPALTPTRGISTAPRILLDKTLTDAGVPLAASN